MLYYVPLNRVLLERLGTCCRHHRQRKAVSTWMNLLSWSQASSCITVSSVY